MIKRDGTRQPVSFDKILARIKSLADGLTVDPVRVAKGVIHGVHDGVKTSDLDDLAAETAAALAAKHPDYSFLAARIANSNLEKMTESSIRCVFFRLADDVREFATKHLSEIDAAFDWSASRPVRLLWLQNARTVLPRPFGRDGKGGGEASSDAHASGTRNPHGRPASGTRNVPNDVRRSFTHATPTMFNAGTRLPTLASCFLLPIQDDSIEGIFDTQKRCALISKSAGGIGLSVSNVRAKEVASRPPTERAPVCCRCSVAST